MAIVQRPVISGRLRDAGARAALTLLDIRILPAETNFPRMFPGARPFFGQSGVFGGADARPDIANVLLAYRVISLLYIAYGDLS